MFTPRIFVMTKCFRVCWWLGELDPELAWSVKGFKPQLAGSHSYSHIHTNNTETVFDRLRICSARVCANCGLKPYTLHASFDWTFCTCSEGSEPESFNLLRLYKLQVENSSRESLWPDGDDNTFKSSPWLFNQNSFPSMLWRKNGIGLNDENQMNGLNRHGKMHLFIWSVL